MSEELNRLSESKKRAATLIELLAPTCERIQVAGSIRRAKTKVKDIELVAIPVAEREENLFGEPVGNRYPIDDLLSGLNVKLSKNGDRYKQFEFEGQQVDLFLASQNRWGVIFTIRTGDWKFSKKLMTPQSFGGYLPFGMKVKDGRLWKEGIALQTPEEQDYFEVIGLDWIDPRDRGVEAINE